MSMQILIFLLYFAIVFLIGWLSMRATRTDEDYWIAGGKLGWAVGGATMSATHTSAGTFIGTVGVIYSVGWSFTWVLISIPLAYWFVVAVLAPRFTRQKEITLPAYLEHRYNSKSTRAAGGIIILIATVVYIQAQIIAGGLVGSIIFGIPADIGMVIFTIILLLYTVLGGMFAVAYTDFLQMIIMVVGTLVSVPLALMHVGGLEGLLETVQVVKPSTFEWGGLPASLLITMGMAFFLGSVATPEKVVRLYAMKDMKTIRKGILLTMILVTWINLLVFFLGMSAMVLFPSLPSGDLAMPLLAKSMLPAFVGTIMLAALTSAMMSTVDSLLLVAGSALSEDIYQNLNPRKLSEKKRLLIARVGIVVVGITPLILILSKIGEGELIQFIVILFTAIMASGFFVPVVGGILWKRATAAGALTSMIGGVLVTGWWKAAGDPSIYPVLPGVAISTVLYVVVSLLTKPPPRENWKVYFQDPPQN